MTATLNLIELSTPVFAAESVLGGSPSQFWGIPLALVGAVLMSFGAQYQSRGLNKVERLVGTSAATGLSVRHVLSMLRRPSWVVGSALLGLAVVAQISSLALAPLIVVQPIGVVALVVTSILNARLSRVHLGRKVMTSLTMCVTGIVIFVIVAAFTAQDQVITDQKLITILIIFAVIMVITCTLFLLFRHRAIALIYIIGAGVLYGFVATFAKAVISRLQQDEFEALTWVCVAALVLGALLGMVFVQNAYASGPPDLVIAGLTVVDPLIAVLIGIVVLNEAAGAPLWAYAVFVCSGVIALIGVWGLAKYHPQVGQRSLTEV